MALTWGWRVSWAGADAAAPLVHGHHHHLCAAREARPRSAWRHALLRPQPQSLRLRRRGSVPL
eukprot:161069-Rhodomonas_salina.3